MAGKLEYDGTLKDIFQHDRPVLLEILAGDIPVRRFVNVELPKVIQPRSDLIAERMDGSLLHLEFQSENDPDMGWRMAMYHLLMKNRLPNAPFKHVVLYVGEARLTMQNPYRTEAMDFRFEIRDIRSIDTDRLLASDRAADRALAALSGGEARLGEVIRSVRSLTFQGRRRALSVLRMLGGLRSFAVKLREELRRMPILIDIENNVLLQDVLDDAREKASAKGRREGLATGRGEGKLEMVRRILTARFGRLPKWAEARLATARPATLDSWAVKALTAATLKDVIGPRA